MRFSHGSDYKAYSRTAIAMVQDGGEDFIRYFGKFVPDYTASRLRRRSSSCVALLMSKPTLFRVRRQIKSPQTRKTKDLDYMIEILRFMKS